VVCSFFDGSVHKQLSTRKYGGTERIHSREKRVSLDKAEAPCGTEATGFPIGGWILLGWTVKERDARSETRTLVTSERHRSSFY
jgi:hypothetical protein